MAQHSNPIPISESSSAPVLHIQLLGNFRLVYGDQSVTSIEAPRLQALLAYLLLHRDAPQPRQHLAFLLYPDSSEAQARTNLRNQMHYLRKALPNAEDFLIADAQTVQWNSNAPFTLDVAAFENTVQQANSSTALREAVNLYGGELFPGCYDDWVLPEREQLRQKFIETLERLILLLENQRDYRAAISFTERLLRQDPLREETYRRLMRLYVLSGDSAGARRVYQTCVAVLKRELDAEPSAETRAEFERITDRAVSTERVVKPDSPPPKSVQPIPNNLPVQLTSFIGREQQIADLKRLLSLQNISSRTRLVTFTGAGGSGKTRLAIQVAHELLPSFHDGVWFVDLSSLSDAALIPQAIASALSVHEQPGRTLLDTLLNYLHGKELLLIFDNCEQFVAACAELVQTLLEKCPRLQIIATSRERLNLADETVWLVPTLALPESENAEWLDAPHSEAVRLFVERAVSALPTFSLTQHNAQAVAQICRRLDGIPLAIELAAARIKLLTPTQIATRLDDAFHLLTRASHAAPPRQQTLRAAMDWSYELLSAPEQMLFRRLSVFAGGFTLESAEQVCSDDERLMTKDESQTDSNLGRSSFVIRPSDILDLLSDLVDKSLVVVAAWEEGEQVRYRMLEPVREYADEKLMHSSERDRIRHQHFTFFFQFAESAEPHFRSTDHLAWIKKIKLDYDNLRTALQWSVPNDPDSGLRLVGALFWLWYIGGYEREGRQWAEDLLAHSSVHARPEFRAQALFVVGAVAVNVGDFSVAHKAFEESLASFLKAGDNWWSAIALREMGRERLYLHDLSAAQACFEAGLVLARELQDNRLIADLLHSLGTVVYRSDPEAARPFLEQSVALSRNIGDMWMLAWALDGLGTAAMLQGHYADAVASFEESVALYPHLAEREFLASLLQNLGEAFLAHGNSEKAAESLLKSLSLAIETEGFAFIGLDLIAFGGAAASRGKAAPAARLLAAGAAVLDAHDFHVSIWPSELTAYNRYIAHARSQIDDTAFNAAWAEGRAMTMEQAIEYALEEATN